MYTLMRCKVEYTLVAPQHVYCALVRISTIVLGKCSDALLLEHLGIVLIVLHPCPTSATPSITLTSCLQYLFVEYHFFCCVFRGKTSCT